MPKKVFKFLKLYNLSILKEILRIGNTWLKILRGQNQEEKKNIINHQTN